MAIDELAYRLAIAQRMVSVEADCSLLDALTMMRERALVDQVTLIDISEAVIRRRICFDMQRRSDA